MTKKAPTFSDVAKDLILQAENRVRTGVRPPTYARDIRQRFTGHGEPFFGQMKIASIDARKVREFHRYLAEKNLKPSSILAIMSFVRQVFVLAKEDGYINVIPEWKREGHKDAPRPAFDRAEYSKLKTTLKRIEKGNPKVEFKGSVVDKELRLISTFMVNTFFRPGDVFVLQHKHVEVVERAGEPGYLRFTMPASKNHHQQTVSLPAAVFIYKNVTAFNAKKGHGVGPDDYVFLPDRKCRPYAKEIVRRQFNQVLQIAGLAENAKGERRSMYSLRHSSIMFRLLNSDGLDLLTLARAAKTSVEMIDRFYASSLTAELNRGKLFSFKYPTRYASPSKAA